MKRILCFGDSNTWGYDPASQDRMDDRTRWTRVMGRILGSDYEVIEEGLCGRTTVLEDPIEGYRNGRTYFIPCLETHQPLDAVVILLGTNDLKKRFSLSAREIAEGAGLLVHIAQSGDAGIAGKPPRVLLLAPPPLAKLTEFAEMFEGAQEKSKKFSEQFDHVAREYGCAFLDTAKVIVSSPLDGIHWEKGEHAKLGDAVSKKIKEMIG